MRALGEESPLGGGRIYLPGVVGFADAAGVGVGLGEAACARPPVTPRLSKAAAVPPPMVFTANAANGFMWISSSLVIDPIGSTFTMRKRCQPSVGPASSVCNPGFSHSGTVGRIRLGWIQPNLHR